LTTKKVLFVSPEVPSGGTGVYIWQLAQAAKKWSNWESYIVSPMMQAQEEIAATLDGYHKIDTKKKKMFGPEKALQLLKEAHEYALKNDFDMVYFNSEQAFSSQAFLIGDFPNPVCSIHTHHPYIKKFDSKKPITDQIPTLQPAKIFKNMMSCGKYYKAFHLISQLESQIFDQLVSSDLSLYNQQYIVYPNLLYSTEEYYPSNYEDRDDKVIFSGRVTNYIKGLAIIRELAENTDLEYVITVPYGNVAGAKKFFQEFPNCEVLYYPKHEDALRELAKHKVFCNPGTYGPYDLTMLEAANQGCQIVSNTCIGATDYFTKFFKPEEHTGPAFEKAIRAAFKQKEPSRIIPNSMEENIQNFLDSLYWVCCND